MKLKVKTPEQLVIGFTRRELMLMSNCLNEACHGMLMDRFIPAHDELISIHKGVKEAALNNDFFKLTPATV